MMVLMHHMPWSKWILCFKGPVDVMWRGTTVVMILKLRLNPINQCWDDLNHVACMVTSLIFYPYPSLDWDMIDVNCTPNFQGEGWAKSFGQRNKLDQKCDPGEGRSVSEQKLKFLLVLCPSAQALGIALVSVCVLWGFFEWGAWAQAAARDTQQEMATHASVKPQSVELIQRHVCIFRQPFK